MKAKIENKTGLRKGDCIYHVVGYADPQKYTITDIKVLSNRWIEVTAMTKGLYSWMPEHKDYEHIIAYNNNRNVFVDKEWCSDVQKAIQRVRTERYKDEAISFYKSAKTIIETYKRL